MIPTRWVRSVASAAFVPVTDEWAAAALVAGGTLDEARWPGRQHDTFIAKVSVVSSLGLALLKPIAAPVIA